MAERIVVCDDERHIVYAIETKLSKAGYEVVTVPDGQTAWEQIQRNVPDLLITDCQMPKMDGLELCRRLREQPETRQLPIILLTAKGFELSEDELRADLSINELVCKPFSPRALLKSVQDILASAMTVPNPEHVNEGTVTETAAQRPA